MHLDLAIVSLADEASVPVDVRMSTEPLAGLRLSVGGRNIAADMGATLTEDFSLRWGT